MGTTCKFIFVRAVAAMSSCCSVEYLYKGMILSIVLADPTHAM